jgi:hypothetical protein
MQAQDKSMAEEGVTDRGSLALRLKVNNALPIY